MTGITSPLDDKSQQVTGEALQRTLVDLIDLGLVAKQLHWNVLGPHFRSVHLQLDELVAASRSFSDQVAERAVAIGVSPDGRAATVAEHTTLPAPKSGWIGDEAVVGQVVTVLDGVVERLRAQIEAIAEPDPVSQDLLIAVAAELEKQRWMFQAQVTTA